MATTLTLDAAQIERQLQELWQSDDERITRASLFNFITYCESETDRDHVTGVISELTNRHPCRAIVLLARREEKKDGLSSAISAHCHLAGGGRKQVCCEQISIEASGTGIARLGTVVLPLLEADLPTVLWWRGNFLENAPAFAPLVDVANRLIYRTEDPGQFDALAKSLEANRSCAYTDLAWTRLDLWRKLTAECFDEVSCREELKRLESVEISYGRRPGARVRSLLLAGWVVAQLNYAGKIQLVAQEEDAGITGITLRSARGTFNVKKDLGERAASARVEMPECCGLPRKQAFVPGDDATLLALELDRPAGGGTYEKALRAAAKLFFVL